MPPTSCSQIPGCLPPAGPNHATPASAAAPERRAWRRIRIGTEEDRLGIRAGACPVSDGRDAPVPPGLHDRPPPNGKAAASPQTGPMTPASAKAPLPEAGPILDGQSLAALPPIPSDRESRRKTPGRTRSADAARFHGWSRCRREGPGGSGNHDSNVAPAGRPGQPGGRWPGGTAVPRGAGSATHVIGRDAKTGSPPAAATCGQPFRLTGVKSRLVWCQTASVEWHLGPDCGLTGLHRGLVRLWRSLGL